MNTIILGEASISKKSNKVGCQTATQPKFIQKSVDKIFHHQRRPVAIPARKLGNKSFNLNKCFTNLKIYLLTN